MEYINKTRDFNLKALDDNGDLDDESDEFADFSVDDQGINLFTSGNWKLREDLELEVGLRAEYRDIEIIGRDFNGSVTRSSGNMLAEYHFDSQTEGCVYNTVDQQLYVGQEDKGIWKIAPMSGKKTLIETMAQGNLVADVEGLDIYYGDQQYLIASSQGDDSYVVYQIAPWKMLSKFRIAPNTHTGLDGASETDGLAVSAKPIKDYPQGIMVVQDGRNVSPAANQNFKIINWQKIEGLLKK
ncbi:MAG: 3-phytase [Zhongshania sp.]|jgi:3-phytase